MSEFKYNLENVHSVHDNMIDEINRLQQENGKMLEMLNELKDHHGLFPHNREEIKQLIQQATTI